MWVPGYSQGCRPAGGGEEGGERGEAGFGTWSLQARGMRRGGLVLSVTSQALCLLGAPAILGAVAGL